MRFDSYHPGINLIFFAAVLIFTGWWNHPVFIGISFVVAFIWSIVLNGGRQAIFNCILVALGVVYVLLYITNTHFGVTVFAHTVIGNQVTVEALLYGCLISTKIVAIIMWLSCLLATFTSDKVVYLLGKVSPKLSLFLSIILRAVPVVKQRAHQIGTAQRCLGRGVNQGNIFRRIHNLVRQISIVITWTIERFVESSESMRSRGSNLRGRRAFSIFRFDNRDRSVVLMMILLITICCAAMALDQTHILYAPAVVMNRITVLSYVFYGVFALLCLLPLILQIYAEAHQRAAVRSMEEASVELPPGLLGAYR